MTKKLLIILGAVLIFLPVSGLSTSFVQTSGTPSLQLRPTLSTNKSEYQKGEEIIRVELKNNTNEVIFFTEPDLGKEVKPGVWNSFSTRPLCACGVLCEGLIMVLLKPLKPGQTTTVMSWDQNIVQCINRSFKARSTQALAGKYRVKLDYYYCENSKELLRQEKIHFGSCQNKKQYTTYAGFKITGNFLENIIDKTPILKTIYNEKGFNKKEIAMIISFIIVGGLLVLIKKFKELKLRIISGLTIPAVLVGCYLYIKNLRIWESEDFWFGFHFIAIIGLVIWFKLAKNPKLRLILLLLIGVLAALFAVGIFWLEFKLW